MRDSAPWVEIPGGASELAGRLRAIPPPPPAHRAFRASSSHVETAASVCRLPSAPSPSFRGAPLLQRTPRRPSYALHRRAGRFSRHCRFVTIPELQVWPSE